MPCAALTAVQKRRNAKPSGEKALGDYRAQLGRPFEHEARLRELLAKLAQLNAALDRDKHNTQVVAEAPEPEEKSVPTGFAARVRTEGCAVEMAP
jgi:hypothetical protein